MVYKPKTFTILLFTEKLCQPVLGEDTLSYFRWPSTISEKHLDPTLVKLKIKNRKIY